MKGRKMTVLEKIDQRLSLYPEYLWCWLDYNYPNFPSVIDLSFDDIPTFSPLYLLKMYQQTGNYFYTKNFIPEGPEELLTFDEWLVKNNYPDLLLS